jgi:exopolyphosphatase/guanosine-5'-triphosphate,3'-diphosphate pyrophosphatase
VPQADLPAAGGLGVSGVPALRKAAIDIGTVSTRLLVADVAEDGELREVLRRTVVTHLGENLTTTGRLSDDAMARVTGVVQGFLRDCAELGVGTIAAIATSAARDAVNGEVLLDRLEVLGVRPEIVTGGREAQLSFLGATYAVDDEDILVADLGGGSTELILGSVVDGDGCRRVEIETARSIDVGSRRVTELYLASDPPTPDELGEASAWAAAQLRPFFDGLRSRPRSLVALAGTATTLSAIRLGLATYDATKVHGSKLSGGDLASLKEELAAMPLAERVGVVGLDPGRAPVIVAGALILEVVLGLAGLDSVTVSEHDILYGMVLTDE